MYFIDEFHHKDGSVFYECVMQTEVNLDDLENNMVQLRLKPYDEDIKIVKNWYHKDDTFEGSQGIEYYHLNCKYDKDNDRIELALKSSFDKFIYSICRLLSIGHISLYNNCVEDVEEREHVSSISENHISTIILTLEEFKRLDGFCGVIDVSGLSVIYFKGLHMSVKALKENACDGFERPDGRTEYLLRGEKLFKWD